ncbi:MAG: hypothetical protein ACYTGH_13930, partial [Planctomycetota bacterium]
MIPRWVKPILILSLSLLASSRSGQAGPRAIPFQLTVRGHDGLIPHHRQAPQVDGSGEDGLWQEADTDAGVIATPEGGITHRVRFSTDGRHLHLLITGSITSTAVDRLSLELHAPGSSPYRIDLSGADAPQHFLPTGRAQGRIQWRQTQTPRLPGVQAARRTQALVETHELSIPLVPLGLARTTAEDLYLRVVCHQGGTDRLSRLSLRAGRGALLGGRIALLNLTLNGAADGPGQGQLEILYHGPEVSGATLRLRPSLLSGGEDPSTAWRVPILRPGRSQHPLVFHRLPAGPLHHLEFELTFPDKTTVKARMNVSMGEEQDRPYLMADLIEALPAPIDTIMGPALQRRGERALGRQLARWLQGLRWSVAEAATSIDPDSRAQSLLQLGKKLGSSPSTHQQVLAHLQGWNPGNVTPDLTSEMELPFAKGEMAEVNLQTTLDRTQACLALCAPAIRHTAHQGLIPRLLLQALRHHRLAYSRLMDPDRRDTHPLKDLHQFGLNSSALSFLPESRYWLEGSIELLAERCRRLTF